MPDNVFDGQRVSDEWDVVLTAARRDGVRFTLNSGRRTLADQWRLVREKGVWSPSNRTGAARPSPWAPHIRVGRIDHAIDVNAVDGGETRLQHWLEQHGARPTNPVPGEPWHLELTARELRALAARLDPLDDTPTLRKGVVHPAGVRRLQRLLRALNVRGVPLNGRYDLATRAGVKRWQRKKGLPTDARATVGPKTWAALARAVR